MSLLKYIVPVIVLVGGVALTSTASYGKAEYVKTTKKTCAFCHVGDAKAKPTVLTPAGEYYKKNKSLDGFVDKK